MKLLSNNRRPSRYDRGEHDLICKAVNCSNDPEASGLTAYEAVCVLLHKLEVAQHVLKEAAKKGDKEAISAVKFLRKNHESFTTIKCYGT